MLEHLLDTMINLEKANQNKIKKNQMLNDKIKKINKRKQTIKNKSGAFGSGSLDSCLIFLFYFCLRSTLLGFFLKFFHQKHSLLLNLFLAGNDLEFDHHCGGREIGYIGIFCLKCIFSSYFHLITS